MANPRQGQGQEEKGIGDVISAFFNWLYRLFSGGEGAKDYRSTPAANWNRALPPRRETASGGQLSDAEIIESQRAADTLIRGNGPAKGPPTPQDRRGNTEVKPPPPSWRLAGESERGPSREQRGNSRGGLPDGSGTLLGGAIKGLSGLFSGKGEDKGDRGERGGGGSYDVHDGMTGGLPMRGGFAGQDEELPPPPTVDDQDPAWQEEVSRAAELGWYPDGQGGWVDGAGNPPDPQHYAGWDPYQTDSYKYGEGADIYAASQGELPQPPTYEETSPSDPYYGDGQGGYGPPSPEYPEGGYDPYQVDLPEPPGLPPPPSYEGEEP